MSLSKPFRLFDLPLLPLEKVLFQLDPMDLLLFALSSKKAIQLLGKFLLVKYFDILVNSTEVEFSICFKSGTSLSWRFFMELPDNASEKIRRSANIEFIISKRNERKIGVFQLDDMKMDLWEARIGIISQVPKEHFVDYIQRIGYLFQSICPDQRIRKLDARKVGWKDEKVFFYMDRNTRCEEFSFEMYDQDNFLEVLEKTDVKRKIYLECNRRNDEKLEWMKNEKVRKKEEGFRRPLFEKFQIRNIPQLKLVKVRNLDSSQFLSLNNEHLHSSSCKVSGYAVNEYLKSWVNGECTKRRTLEVVCVYPQKLDNAVWKGLTKEPVETWEKLGKPGFVQFSDEVYLNPTPQTVPDKYQTVLLKNCHGQFATIVQERSSFYFTQWHHPLPPIHIPEGWEAGFEIRSQVPKEHFVDYTQRIGYFFQSICPGQQIRYLGAGRVGREDENVSFHMDRITRCEEFSFEMYDQDNFLEILEKMDVNWKINLKCNRRNDEELEWMENEKIRNIPQLKVRYFENLDFSQILKLENEHLHLEYCKLDGSVVNAYLKKWMNGEHTRRRRLRVTGDYGSDDKVWDGLTQEPVETWEKLGESKRRLVRFSYKLCLNPTPRTVPGSYQTVLLKNCHGQFATVIEAKNQFFFTPWHHPLPPIGIPEGFKLRESFGSPFARIVAQNF